MKPYFSLIQLRLRAGMALEKMFLERLLLGNSDSVHVARMQRLGLFNEVVDGLIHQYRYR